MESLDAIFKRLDEKQEAIYRAQREYVETLNQSASAIAHKHSGTPYGERIFERNEELKRLWRKFQRGEFSSELEYYSAMAEKDEAVTYLLSALEDFEIAEEA